MGKRISRKKETAIVALLKCDKVVEAAETSGVSERSIYRWLKDPEFKEEYRAARKRLVDLAVKKLQNVMAGAVDTLKEILDAKETKFFQKDGKVEDERDVIAWGPRLGAAKTILEMGIRASELQDLEKRISELEERLSN